MRCCIRTVTVSSVRRSHSVAQAVAVADGPITPDASGQAANSASTANSAAPGGSDETVTANGGVRMAAPTTTPASSRTAR
ncbi:hypothetical protein ABN034_13160 [Actinopolymorpha sp. B11F2]|uniref:hypothetical protein n=1 Tax=Actinopolymorpha sp. B11F2 TaxID=3160862 RepID=UPI0032E400F3